MIEPISGGIFDDDGNKIDPNSIPIPGLCIACRHYSEEDWESELLCNLNRFDQRNVDKFECYQFEKI